MIMNNIIENLFEKARGDKPPKVDVADRVISIITATEKKPELFWDKPLMWIAALSTAAAIPFAMLAFFINNIKVGPLFEISQAISWVM